ncbi:hypothetical protein COW36_15095 [bacterium (Candidatus Blackallbacteria) CG17_big_fil_post_rev_8_21_14_2_50_48_46]|uniref:Uncharacterized protein n=1 Tax=bacterium (Candidatus Blackallbacteria) CG17_big_fil_post_rev_8_21_14_2_50_48_46 TaxID=2014261 RepID=A0A2M7G2L3_9BACT|nr:MAG: hypothetical protein COW64_11455 [bacterium (Candidatus Blackallbacteria) CG18_big_fil_WC_8_21_14_2_50_49_26]PIW16036.1 MAG: hypothetical protein COW36_15095 [bacterium (Candidatus Blackallbacteria) CG17_big_fil_post_rev_8_21_14_2_50_48_46]PIW50448.1 MAG: hypothetical protein COW20_02810 [bacterium (Candidatus Blackallbacteria) CG13_big_fil_rev_8_21_14_2_50_49_14]
MQNRIQGPGLSVAEYLQELEWRVLQMEALARELRQEITQLKSSVPIEELKNTQKMRAYQQMVDSLAKLPESA